MAAKTTVEQPQIDAHKLLSDLIHNEPETVEIEGRKMKMRWLHKDTESRIANMVVRESSIDKRTVKWYSLVRLDRRSGFLTWLLGWSWYWILWRWIWYVRHERCTKFQMEVVEISKKKIQNRSEALALTTILMIEAMDTMMTTARHESGQAGPFGVPITH